MRGILKTLLASDTLTARCLRACSWVSVSNFLLQIIRMFRIWILALLLAPDIFGIIALVWCVLGLMREMSDTGIRHALIQNKRGLEKPYQDVAWSLIFGRNILLILVIFCGAPYLHYLGGSYKNGQLAGLLRLSCLILLFEGLSSIGLVVLQKQLQFRPLMLVQVAAQVVGLAVTVSLAFHFRNAWSIVVGEIAVAFLTCILSYAIYPYRPRLYWRSRIGWELLRYGVMTYFIALVNSLCLRINILILGMISSVYEVGIYNLGLTLIISLSMLLSQLSIMVGFPALSQLQHDLSRIRRANAAIIKATQTVALPMFFLLAIFAHDVVRILPEKYADIGGILRVLSVFGFFRLLLQQISPAFYATNRLHLWLLRGVIQLMLIMVLLIPFYRQWHLAGACWAVNLAVIGANIFSWAVYFRVFGWTAREWFSQTAVLWRGLLLGAIVFLLSFVGLQQMNWLGGGNIWLDRLPYLFAITGYIVFCISRHIRHLHGMLKRNVAESIHHG